MMYAQQSRRVLGAFLNFSEKNYYLGKVLMYASYPILDRIGVNYGSQFTNLYEKVPWPEKAKDEIC